MTDRYKLTQALVVDPLYLQHSYSESAIDYRVRRDSIINVILKVYRFKTVFLSALGHSTEPKVPFLEAVVRDPQLRRERAPGVREEPLQACQRVPGQGRAGRKVQAHERRQGGC